MKKRLFSFLAAISLMVSVGGVYASWTYAASATKEVSGSTKLNLSGIGADSEKGTISVSSSGLTIQIDQIADGDEGYGTVDPHTAVMRITGSMTVTFTPNDNAEKDVRDNGIVLALTITEDYETYTDIVNNTENALDLITLAESEYGNGVYLLKGGEPIKGTYTLDNDTLNSYLILGNLKLESKAEYDSFDSFLNGKRISFTISEYIPTV